MDKINGIRTGGGVICDIVYIYMRTLMMVTETAKNGAMLILSSTKA